MKTSAYDGKHVKSVAAYVLIHESSNRPGKIAGRIVANFSDNPAGSVCTATLHVWSGPLGFIPTCSGRAGGYGYDKLSAAIQSAIGHAQKKRPEYLEDADWEQFKGLEVPHFAGAGMSAVGQWLKQHGYECEAIIGV